MDRSILSVEKQSNKNVRLFFESYAKSFDSIYGHENKRSFIGRTNDRLFRKEMYIRFQQTLKNINNHKKQKTRQQTTNDRTHTRKTKTQQNTNN